MPLPQSNTEFMVDLMTFSRNGPLVQCVVIEGLQKYTADVLKNEAAICRAMADSPLSGPAWIAACREINTKLKERYG